MENEFPSSRGISTSRKWFHSDSVLVKLSNASQSMKRKLSASTHAPRSRRKGDSLQNRYDRNRKHRNRNNWIEACSKEINRAMVKFMYFSPQPRLSFVQQFSFFLSPRSAPVVVLSHCFTCELEALTKQFHFQREIISSDNFNIALWLGIVDSTRLDRWYSKKCFWCHVKIHEKSTIKRRQTMNQ